MRIPTGAPRSLPLVLLLCQGCSHAPGHAKLGPEERFNWLDQPIAFSPPPERWYREGDNGDGMLGVRFVLRDGGGQCISVLGNRRFAERTRKAQLEQLIARRDSLENREFLHQLSLARPYEEPLTPREAEVSRAINDAIDRATQDLLEDRTGFVSADLDQALRAASAYTPTLPELLPHLRLRPEAHPEPWRWRIAYERDTTLADHPAFASDDTLITPDRPLLYREIFWVVNGCAFKAVYQGTPENLPVFAQVVDSIRFPEVGGAIAN